MGPKTHYAVTAAMRAIKWLLLASMGLFLMACGPMPSANAPESPVPLPTFPPSPLRDRAPAAAEHDLAALVAGNNAFAFDLYRDLADSDQNLIFSPLSISTALSMVYPGARNETLRQMRAVLHYPGETVAEEFNALDLALNQGESAGFLLRLANALWVQSRGFNVEPDFLDLLARNYETEPQLVDFVAPDAREEARTAINNWVEQRTDGRIVDIVGPGVLTEFTRLVLVNAIYFKADWLHQFERSQTIEQPFSPLTGPSVAAPMMSDAFYLDYVRGADYQTVSLPYRGDRVRMVAILPDEGAFGAVQARMDSQLLDEVNQALTTEYVELWLPKFDYGSKLELTDVLGAMGMPLLFDDDAAELWGISQDGQLYVSDVIHQALIIVDEEGTEAAAATVVGAGAASEPPEPIRVRFDRPFIYLIQDMESGSLLFLGHVLDPTQK